MGDIGLHFPDTEPRFKNISSLKLLARTNEIVRSQGYIIENIDAVIFAEAPKLASYRNKMQQNLAKTVEVDPGCINIKATTTEGLGFIGKGEGIAAMSVALLRC